MVLYSLAFVKFLCIKQFKNKFSLATMRERGGVYSTLKYCRKLKVLKMSEIKATENFYDYGSAYPRNAHLLFRDWL